MSREEINAGSASGRLRMRDVEVRTGLPRSTLHLYVRRGLLPQPRKTRHNQATYDEEFVRRARLVKLLQAKARLPLESIREALEKIPRGKVQDVDAEQVIDVARRVAETVRLAYETEVEERELLRTTAIRPDHLDALEAAGLIRRRKGARGAAYAPGDVRVALAYARVGEVYRAATGGSAESDYRASPALLRTYRRLMTELARAETVELSRTARLLAVVDTADFMTRMVSAARELIVAIHTRQFLQEISALLPAGGAKRARRRRK